MKDSKLRYKLQERICQINEVDFEDIALEIFHYQAHFNPLYAEYLNLLSIQPSTIQRLSQIPFLPISLFKTHLIKTQEWQAQATFSSSGTTGTTTSKHYVRELEWYDSICKLNFEAAYGALDSYCFLALLPSYMERQGSSLVRMVHQFIKKSNFPQSNFYLDDLEKLSTQLQYNQKNNIPTILIGVSFALWELAEKFPQDLSNCIVMETGGMKGRRKEITRSQLHHILKKAFQVSEIHSEYGMTELFSQAYSKGAGSFQNSQTIRVLTREINDPLTLKTDAKTGVINCIDLGNLDTISFIATDDLGRVKQDNSFEILGRMDASDIRGCNLMIES